MKPYRSKSPQFAVPSAEPRLGNPVGYPPVVCATHHIKTENWQRQRNRRTQGKTRKLRLWRGSEARLGTPEFSQSFLPRGFACLACFMKADSHHLYSPPETALCQRAAS